MVQRAFIDLNEDTTFDPDHIFNPLEIEIQNLTVEIMELTERISNIETLLVKIHDSLLSAT